jgi:hypothetical protein
MSTMIVPEGQTSDEVYDKQHGTRAPDAPAMSEDELLGTKLNPVRDVPLAAANLHDGGASRGE